MGELLLHRVLPATVLSLGLAATSLGCEPGSPKHIDVGLSSVYGGVRVSVLGREAITGLLPGVVEQKGTVHNWLVIQCVEDVEAVQAGQPLPAAFDIRRPGCQRDAIKASPDDPKYKQGDAFTPPGNPRRKLGKFVLVDKGA